MSNEVLAKYTANSGSEIVIDAQTIRKMICDNEAVTDKECFAFAAMCKNYKIDPFIKEAYLVKYKDNPAQMIVGKDYWMKQASSHAQYDGMESGVTVVTKEGIVRREGTLVGASTERLVGGWARVYRKDRSHPSFAEVSLDEYSTGRSMWKSAKNGGKPATMIAKVAEVQALRKAFPETFSGLYSEEEMDQAVPVKAEQEDLPPVINHRDELVRACREYAERFGRDAKEVMAEQVTREDYAKAKESGDEDILNLWFITRAEELDAIVPAEQPDQEPEYYEYEGYEEQF